MTAPSASRAPSLLRLPRPSLRFLPIYRRNLLVWRKLAVASVLGNIADPLITLVAFGYGLGRLLNEVQGVPYIVFLAAGSACMSTAMAASFESLYSAYSRMQVQQTWASIMNAPVDLDDVLIAEWLWAATKGLFSGLAITAVILALGLSREPTLIALPLVVMLTGLAFAGIGLCFNALARGYDFFTYYFTLVITPMVFLSGVYYPRDTLPGWLAAIASALPLAAAVDLARPLVLGEWPAQAAWRVSLLLAVALVSFGIALVLTRRRFRV
ncbi:MAG: ABC transporter permease [Betaproteobacteria bacterium]|nr:ABC transporter permease [Betaproteobacteria bacterium]